MMAAATDVAEIIGEMVSRDKDVSPDAVSAAVYATLWSPQNRCQRDFQVFGGEFLMRQSVTQLRGFFSAFFSVDQEVWSGFLAGWPGLPGNHHHDTWNARFKFCLDLFLKMPNPIRFAIVSYAVIYTLENGPNNLLRSLLPLLGTGPKPSSWQVR